VNFGSNGNALEEMTVGFYMFGIHHDCLFVGTIKFTMLAICKVATLSMVCKSQERVICTVSDFVYTVKLAASNISKILHLLRLHLDLRQPNQWL
jgi:hypothetical protein